MKVRSWLIAAASLACMSAPAAAFGYNEHAEFNIGNFTTGAIDFDVHGEVRRTVYPNKHDVHSSYHSGDNGRGYHVWLYQGAKWCRRSVLIQNLGAVAGVIQMRCVDNGNEAHGIFCSLGEILEYPSERKCMFPIHASQP